MVEEKPKEEKSEALPGEDKIDQEIQEEIKTGKKEEKPEEETKEEKEEKTEEVKPEVKTRKRTPRLIPAFTHEIEKRKWKKEKDGLQETITDLNTKLKSKPDVDTETQIKEVAEKHGVEVGFLKDVFKILGGRTTITDDLRKEIVSLKKGQEKVDRDREDRGFNDDFEDNILPVLEKAEVSKQNVKALKKLLHEQAFTERYAPYALDDVFYALRRKGLLDEILGKKEPGKKSAEDSGSVGIRGKELKVKVKDMTDKEFDAFDAALEKDSKKGGFEVRRDLKKIKI